MWMKIIEFPFVMKTPNSKVQFVKQHVLFDDNDKNFDDVHKI